MAQKPDNIPAVTIYEIAEHVGVSPGAVSSALANRGVERRLSAETVQRIRDAARELGYVPNMAGRRLRAHKAATRQFDLAILTTFEAPLPLVSQILASLQREIDVRTDAHTRYSVSIEMYHAGRLSQKSELLSANRYHAVVVTNTLHEDDAFLAQARLPCTTVVIGRRIAGYCCVLEASDYVGRCAAEILLDAGCCRPAVLRSRVLTYTTANRVEAFASVIKARSGNDPVALVCEGLLPQHGDATLDEFLSAGGNCDGLFAVTDSLAYGAYKAVKRRNMRIPEDMAVVGIGDFGLAEYFDPPLTTVAGANDAMVSEAVPLLFQLLHGQETSQREVFVVPPVLHRASTQKRP